MLLVEWLHACHAGELAADGALVDGHERPDRICGDFLADELRARAENPQVGVDRELLFALAVAGDQVVVPLVEVHRKVDGQSVHAWREVVMAF